MRVAVVIARAQWVSGWRTFRGDGRYRVAWLIVAALGLPLAWWGAQQLALSTASAAARGSESLARQVGHAMLSTWTGMTVLALLSARQYVLGRLPNDLLFALPIAAAARWRALWAQVAAGGLGSWALLGMISFGFGLLPSLGPLVLAWLLLFLAGSACAATVALALLLLWLSGARRWAAGLLLAAGIAAGSFALLVPATAARWGALAAAAGPALAGALAHGFLLGPFAGTLGRRYEAAYFASLAGKGSGAAPAALAGRIAARVLLPRRSLAGGLLLKELTARSRHWTNWLRLLAVTACAAAYPWLSRPLHDLTAAYPWLSQPGHGLPAGAIVPAACALGLIYLTVFDSASSPIGAEGDRLNLFLTMPITWRRFLAARWKVFYACYGLPGLVLGLLFCGLDRLPLAQAGLVVAALAVMFAGVTGVFAWGSAWDAAPERPFSTGFQAIMEEDVPFTPQRMALSIGALLLLAGQVAWLAAAPSVAAVTGIGVANGLVLVVTWRFGVTLEPELYAFREQRNAGCVVP